MEQKTTVASQIANELALRISKGMLHPNQHLVEVAIAEEFKTSRAPVREALLMLEKDRLVERQPHRGFVVKKFSKQEIHQLYDATFRLEEIAMKKAIDNVTPENIAFLEDLLEKQREAMENDDVVRYYALNEQFHAYILSIANNQFITEMHQSLRRSSQPLSFLNIGQGSNMKLSYEEHSRQLEALKKRDLEYGLQAIRDQEARSVKTLDIFYIE
ncbi:transcriptional regulator [Alicyclobacillus acidoterrestris]|uniref:GntR family transcriptional regulator n=1 Tax=Alicyclobacillus suci TaxID=2816080 RepID=UPI00119474DC|nr:GntR family transcriptional regulator [Alicyclobacillus suci]GEO26427.1 transcriptional regulator [Alicyclobacillus acidoterrestris]